VFDVRLKPVSLCLTVSVDLENWFLQNATKTTLFFINFKCAYVIVSVRADPILKAYGV
jgi:hypothetical protein